MIPGLHLICLDDISQSYILICLDRRHVSKNCNSDSRGGISEKWPGRCGFYVRFFRKSCGQSPPLIKGGEGGFYMRNIGLRILRFSDREVFENIEGVIKEDMGEDMIWKISPNPSFSKRGVIHRKARRTKKSATAEMPYEALSHFKWVKSPLP